MVSADPAIVLDELEARRQGARILCFVVTVTTPRRAVRLVLQSSRPLGCLETGQNPKCLDRFHAHEDYINESWLRFH